jgi:spore germination protein KA
MVKKGGDTMNLFTAIIRLLRRAAQHKSTQKPGTPSPQKPLSPSLERNLAAIVEALGESDDIVQKKLLLQWEHLSPIPAAVIYIDGMADKDVVQNTIIASLLDRQPPASQVGSGSLTELLKATVLSTAASRDAVYLQDALLDLLSGAALVLIEGHDAAISIPVQGWPDREVTESTAQTVVRGPQDAFTENVLTNLTLVRRRIKDPRVRCVRKTIGTATRTNVMLMYMDGIADDKQVAELGTRLDGIDLEVVLEGEYLEESLNDTPLSLFPTIFNTDRPDAVCTHMMQGKIAVIIDGSPFALVLPVVFTDFIQSPEDHYQSFYYSTLVRLLRMTALFIATLFPSVYIALTTFDQEMLPTSLLFSLAAQREGTPFPAFIEAVLMEVTFEILREAGIRMPRTIGQAVSIVGTIVIGQAAVEAGIVSAGMVIVVSLTAISSFAIPSYSLGIAARIVRFFFIALAAVFGVYGLFIGIILLMVHLCSLRSLGTPYMKPFAPHRSLKQYDALIRVPYWFSRRR